jgi:hypothetical protein
VCVQRSVLKIGLVLMCAGQALAADVGCCVLALHTHSNFCCVLIGSMQWLTYSGA